jgi:hypothetical protein
VIKVEWVEFIPRNENEEEVKSKLLNRKIKELLIQEFLSILLKREGWWVKSHINLWELIDSYGSPLEVLDRYDHPLQPDIDILCARNLETPTTPLIGYEVKFFSNYKQIVIPKTSEGKGYYSGIEQALSLLTYGIDYAILWHVFLVPFEEWERRSDLDRIINENVEWSACYAQFIEQGFIKNFHLPIGYKATALSVRKDRKRVQYFDFCRCDAQRVEVFSPTAARLRILLTDKLGIKESIYQRSFLEELIKIGKSRVSS